MRTYDVYWAPEGRKIATVSAKNERDAIRKAPLPYRKYPGEIYATGYEIVKWRAGLTLQV
jgi:hypothetical protein